MFICETEKYPSAENAIMNLEIDGLYCLYNFAENRTAWYVEKDNFDKKKAILIQDIILAIHKLKITGAITPVWWP